MTRIVVLGGTGYAGSAIATEAARRGHEVTAFSRNAPTDRIEGVTYVTGSVLEPADLRRAVEGAEVIASALAPSGDLVEGAFERANADIAALSQQIGARLGVVGGAGTLLQSEGGPKVFESPHYPEEYRGYSLVADNVLQALRASDDELDWFVLSPPRGFGSYLPGEVTGHYRVGGDVALSAGDHPAAISGADYALAFVDEIDRPVHRRERFTVAH